MQKFLKYSPFVILALLAGLYFYNKYQRPPSVDFKKIHLSDLSGNSVDFESLKGKPFILSFGASWCPNCIDELNILKKIKNTDLKDIEVVVISDEPVERVQTFKEKRDYPFTFLKMEEAFPQIGINSIPVSYLYNSKLEVVEQTVGTPDWDDPSYVEHAKKLMQN